MVTVAVIVVVRRGRRGSFVPLPLQAEIAVLRCSGWSLLVFVVVRRRSFVPSSSFDVVRSLLQGEVVVAVVVVVVVSFVVLLSSLVASIEPSIDPSVDPFLLVLFNQCRLVGVAVVRSRCCSLWSVVDDGAVDSIVSLGGCWEAISLFNLSSLARSMLMCDSRRCSRSKCEL